VRYTDALQLLIASTFAASLAPAAGRAQQLNPAQPLTFIVAFAPGGVADGIARIIGQKLGDRLGLRVVVENRAGAGGNLAAKIAASAEPDGHTILATTTAIAINETLYKNKGYETAELQAIAVAASTPEVLAVNPSTRTKTLRGFVEAFKDKSVTFASAGVGSGSYIAAEYFFRTQAPLKLVHVPFQGGAPAVNAAVGNHVDLLAISLPSVASQINQGALRGIAIAASARKPVVPDVPTYAESGYPEFIASSWVAFLTSAKVEKAIVRHLNKVIQEILMEPTIDDRLRGLGFEPLFNSSDAADALVRSEIRHWGEMVRAINSDLR